MPQRPSAVLRNAQGTIQIDDRRVEPARPWRVRCSPVGSEETPLERQEVARLLEMIGEAQVVDHSQGPAKYAHRQPTRHCEIGAVAGGLGALSFLGEAG